MRPNGFFAGLIAVVLCAAAGQAQENKTLLVPVTYDGLKQEVLKNRGKVLVVDFWQSSCFPCKKAFPHFVDLHKKYAGQGLVIITVSVDIPPAIDKKKELALAFLRDANSPFRNLHLADPIATWEKKLALDSLPCYYVFDRRGKWVRFGGDPDAGVKYDDLDDAVRQMLQEK